MSHSFTRRWLDWPQGRSRRAAKLEADVAGFLLTRVGDPQPLSSAAVVRLRSQSLLGIERRRLRRTVVRGLAAAGLPLALSFAFAASFHRGGGSISKPMLPPPVVLQAWPRVCLR